MDDDDTRQVKVHRVVLLVVDTDDLGADGVCSTLENARYPNRCIRPEVVDSETREVEWSDGHPLNRSSTWRAEFERLFPDQRPERPIDEIRYDAEMRETVEFGLRYARDNLGLTHDEYDKAIAWLERILGGSV